MSSWCAVVEVTHLVRIYGVAGCVRGLWKVVRSLDAHSPADRFGHVPRRTMFSASPAIRPLARASARITLRPSISRGLVHLPATKNARSRFAGTGRLIFGSIMLSSFALVATRIHADAQAGSSNVVGTYNTDNSVGHVSADFVVADPSTSIVFPKTMHIPSKVPIPDLSLIGVGVRTVSFLGIKVYSVAFYADLNNPALQVRARFSSQSTPR